MPLSPLIQATSPPRKPQGLGILKALGSPAPTPVSAPQVGGIAGALMAQVGKANPNYAGFLSALKAQQAPKPPPVQARGPLGNTGVTVEVDHSGPAAPNAKGIVALAEKYLGTKYVWGGASPKGFDCSGFVQWLYGQQGVKLSRTTYTQIKQGKPVDMAHLAPGDVVFFSHNGDVHHEGMYIGGGKFIHAPHTGDVVKISSLSDPYYQSQFAGGRRMR